MAPRAPALTLTLVCVAAALVLVSIGFYSQVLARTAPAALAVRKSAVWKHPTDDIEPVFDDAGDWNATIADPANTPHARLAWLWDCMDGTLDAMCRPTAVARANVLPRDEWRAHVRELLSATRPWTALPLEVFAPAAYNLSHHNGSWLEADWIARFAAPALSGSTLDSLELFYPLVPLFAQWTDALHGPAGGPAVHAALLDAVLGAAGAAGGGDGHRAGVLRDDVLYVTVMSYDRVPAAQRRACGAWRNVLTLSSAGWGHVALPHLKGRVAHAAARRWPFSRDPVHFYARRFASSYVGSDAHGRGKLWGLVAAPPSTLPPAWVVHSTSDQWRWLVNAALFVLAPPGVDRGSWRLGELLQYGRVPLLLHNDVPWTPYQHSYDFLDLVRVPSRNAAGGPRDVRAHGAVLRDAFIAPHALNTSAPADDAGAAYWRRLVTPGAMWGPGGVGFAMTSGDLPAFFCVACEFIRAGSAARWRHVRTLHLRAYGTKQGQACPCATPQVWEEAAGSAMGARGTWKLPPTSLLYEMERRLGALAVRYFTPEAVLEHVARFVQAPASAELRCVPRPPTPQPPWWLHKV